MLIKKTMSLAYFYSLFDSILSLEKNIFGQDKELENNY